jgi:hypothetical protein
MAKAGSPIDRNRRSLCRPSCLHLVWKHGNGKGGNKPAQKRSGGLTSMKSTDTLLSPWNKSTRSAFNTIFLLLLVTLPTQGQVSSPQVDSSSGDPITIAEAGDAAVPAEGVASANGSESPQQQGIANNGQGKPKENPTEPEAHGTRLHWQDIPKNVLYDQKAIWTSPFHINRDNARWWLGFGAGTVALIATADRRVSDRLPDSGTMVKVSNWSSQLGADYTIFPLFTSFYLVGKLGDNPRARDTSRISIEALADSEIVLNTLKLATQRPRPEQRNVSLAFWSGGDAFPSGHATKSWALARVIAREFPHPRIIPILAYTLASTVSVTRIGGRRHSPSDALAGSAIGFFIGDFVYRHHHAPSEQSNVVQ